jgi:hypothetical protein
MNKFNLASLPLCLIFLACFQSNSWADTFSKPGVGVTITLTNGLFGRTEQGDISGSYQTQNAEGILFAAPQATTGSLGESDIAYFNFVDTQGQDRCYGSASLSSGGINIWEIKGAVPGYSCSTVGEVYRFNFGR